MKPFAEMSEKQGSYGGLPRSRRSIDKKDLRHSLYFDRESYLTCRVGGRWGRRHGGAGWRGLPARPTPKKKEKALELFREPTKKCAYPRYPTPSEYVYPCFERNRRFYFLGTGSKLLPGYELNKAELSRCPRLHCRSRLGKALRVCKNRVKRFDRRGVNKLGEHRSPHDIFGEEETQRLAAASEYLPGVPLTPADSIPQATQS